MDTEKLLNDCKTEIAIYYLAVRFVCDKFKLKDGDLFSKRRLAHISLPRQLAISILRKYTGLSFPTIGRLFLRHHATVIYACNKYPDPFSFMDTYFSLESGTSKLECLSRSWEWGLDGERVFGDHSVV